MKSIYIFDKWEAINFYIEHQNIELSIDFDYEVENEDDSYSDEFGFVSFTPYQIVSEIEINKIYDGDDKDYTKEFSKDIKSILLEKHQEEILKLN